MKNIVIIGGSHSGFSCAWMLLNGPAMYYKNTGSVSVSSKPKAMKKKLKSCPECCQCKPKIENQAKQSTK